MFYYLSKSQASLARVKEQVESVTEERDKLSNDCQRSTEAQRRAERLARDARDELGDMQRKEGEASQRKHDLVYIFLHPQILLKTLVIIYNTIPLKLNLMKPSIDSN